MPLSYLKEESLNFLTLVPSVPCLRNILEVRLRQTVVAIMTQEASKSYSITKLNSRLEFYGGLVD
jgi:hypothetical protein